MVQPASLRSAERIVELCTGAGLTLVTAESCTGGLVAGALTEVPGASEVLVGGFVTYTAATKRSMLGLEEAFLEEHGTVGPETSEAMAEAALTVTEADISLAVTGWASPGPGVPDDAVGDVHFASCFRGELATSDVINVPGDRAEVRRQAVHSSLGLLIRQLEDR